MIIVTDKEPKAADRKTAQQHAKAIAGLLSSKVFSYQRKNLGYPQCHYRIPFHVEEFWCKILVSDNAYVFTGEHKRANAFSCSFCAAVKNGWGNMDAKTHLPNLSLKLGVDIYTQPNRSESLLSSVLLSSDIKKLVGSIDFEPISLCYMNPVQIIVISKLMSDDHCAKQVQIFRNLQLKNFLHHDAQPC